MPLTLQRRQALLGATIATTLMLAVGVGVLPRFGHATPLAVHAASTSDTATAGTPSASSDPQPSEFASSPASDSNHPAGAPSVAPPVTGPPTTAASTDATASSDSSSSSTPDPAGPASLPFGQRINATSAQVQAAIAALHQRIPLFQPTDQQLRTFAEAACASFDQGQTQAQVDSTVQDAVSHIQGASLLAADADFAVRTVVELRCPGSL